MNIEQKRELQLEVLVSTQNRNNLDFLHNMFNNNSIEEHNILIVNQTSEPNLLKSDYTNVRVINSFEKGLSKSRNLAIENANADICLIADDDVVFEPDFSQIILDAYISNQDADILTFQTLTTHNEAYSKYPKSTTRLKPFLKKVLSIEVTFKRASIISHSSRFNENFGLGGHFEDSETYLFLRQAILNNNLKAYFVPRFIVKHQPTSSSDDVASDRFIYARSALNYKLYGRFSYLYILKLLFSLARKGKLKFSQIGKKFKIAKQGINHFKKLNNAS